MRWIFRIIGLLIMVAVFALGALFLLPADQVARIATDQMRSFTGRDVRITGDVDLTFWPVLGVRAGGLEVDNAEWSKQGPMLSAANAAIGVDVLQLIRGEIRITNIEAESPTIRLEQRSDGRASWQFSDATGDAVIETQTSPARPARAVSIQRLEVTNATLIYAAEGSELVSFEGVDLSLDWPERLGSADIRAVLRPAGQAVEVDATIDGFADFITGEVRPITASVATKSGHLGVVGRASTTGAVAGKLTLATDDTAAFLRNLGLRGAELPAGLGRQIDLTTELTLTPDRRLAMRDLTADLGGNRLTGAADISLNGVPQINAQLNAGAFDLKPALGSGGGSDAGTAPSGGWSRAPIDASGLAAFNGDIVLTASSIDTGSIKLGQTRAVVRNDQSRMVFELREAAAYGGALGGEFVVNNRSGLSVGGKLTAQGIQVQPLLTDMAGLKRLTGKGDARVSFLGVGKSVDAIMKSLSGDGALLLGRGTIEGINLDSLMRSGDVSGGTTVFDSMAAQFNMAGGVLRNDDLLMLLPNFQTSGAGDIDLGWQAIDYTFTPKVLNVNKSRGLAIPVRIVGPWSDPKIKPDLQAAIDQNFAEEKQELENKAKAKLKEELGLASEDDRSVEDAAKDKVEDKLKKELFKLFD